MSGVFDAVAMCDGECAPAPGGSSGRLVRIAAAAVLALAAGFLACAEASTARAGVIITNTADVSYDLDGARLSASTSTASFRVDELVSFEIADVATDTPGLAGFTVRSTGNGCEALVLLAAAEDGSPAFIAIDADGDSLFNPTRDARYSPGAAPVLCPGDSVHVFVVIERRAPGAFGEVVVSLRAHGTSVAGGRGAVAPGVGDGGTDVLNAGDALRRRIVVMPQPPALRVTLVKSQAVVGQPSALRVEAGDIIAYTLRMSAVGEGLVENALLQDPLPAGVAYVPDSLTLDGHPISDGADAAVVTVSLPAAAAPFDRVIAFRARVLAQ